MASKLRWLQEGRIQIYVLYIALTILDTLDLEARLKPCPRWRRSRMLSLAMWLAPLLPGVINRIKAWFAGRRGPPLLQAYYDLWKLLHKGAVYSRRPLGCSWPARSSAWRAS